MPCEGHRLALNNIDAKLIGKKTHDRGLLNPGNRFKFLAALVQRDKENIASNVFPEHWKKLRARDLSESNCLDVACAGNAEAPVALQIGLGELRRGDEKTANDERSDSDRYASHRAGRPPPSAASLTFLAPFCARKLVAVRIIHLKRHAGQRAPRSGYTLLHAPEAGTRGRIIFPDQGPRCGVTLILHA